MAPPVFLNHFYLTLDRATFAAVRDNDYLKTVFAPFEQRTTQRNDTSYTGIYFYGRNTYFEFFEEGSEFAKVTGSSGIALGVQQEGGVRQLAGVLADQTTLTRRTETGEPFWFHSAAPAGSQRADFFRTWVMEYHKDFLAQWYPDLPPHKASSLSRKNVLDRYVAKIGLDSRRGEFLLKDVTHIELALAEASRSSFLRLLEAFGYQISGAGMSVATGPEARILLVEPSGGGAGIRRVTMSLQRSVAGELRQRYGSSELVISPRGEAVWSFG